MGILDGQVALVTGAGQGCGRGVALAFAAEGASVVVAGRTEHTLLHVAGEIRDRGGVALPVLCDVGINEQIDDAVETAASTFGTIDILVNAAHHNVRRGTLLDMPDEDVELLWTTGPRATLRFMRRSYPLLRGGGTVINFRVSCTIESTKLRLIRCCEGSHSSNITRAAVEWGPDQIRVNVIAPYAESPSMIDDLALQGGAPYISPRSAAWVMRRRMSAGYQSF